MMQKFIPFTFILVTTFLNYHCSSWKKESNTEAQVAEIRLNQIGYLPGSVKKAVIINSSSESFRVENIHGQKVFEGKLTPSGTWELSGEKVMIADFSDLRGSGTYHLSLEKGGESDTFRVGKDIFSQVFHTSMKAFYFHRASTALEQKFAGEYHRPLAHMDDSCRFHPSSGKKKGFLNSPRGWYDAGDYNKYIVNAGITVSILLTFHEYYPEMLSDNALNIPESGNGISDILDEIRWELDWAETMQDTDGGVFFKLTAKAFGGFLPPHQDNLPRFIVGKSTSSALNFAAMFAQAGRVWNEIDPAISAKYTANAIRAWEWAKKNPDIVFLNPKGIFTGAYSHTDFTQDFFWAASQLYVTTGKKEYYNYLKDHPCEFKFTASENWRNYLANIGYYALLLPDSPLPSADKEEFKKALLREADKQIGLLGQNPYRQPLSTFVWGSNSDILDLAMIFAQASLISEDSKYKSAAFETMDYIFGKNATGYCFVTGMGTKPVMNPHHRLSAADEVDQPVPGWVSGGPNSDLNDLFSDKNPNGVKYTSTLPAKAFMDLTESYASNEIAINWNAPLVYMTGFLTAQGNGL